MVWCLIFKTPVENALVDLLICLAIGLLYLSIDFIFNRRRN